VRRVSVIPSGVSAALRAGMEDPFDIRFPPNTEKTCATPGGAAVFDGSAMPNRSECGRPWEGK